MGCKQPSKVCLPRVYRRHCAIPLPEPEPDPEAEVQMHMVNFLYDLVGVDTNVDGRIITASSVNETLSMKKMHSSV